MAKRRVYLDNQPWEAVLTELMDKLQSLDYFKNAAELLEVGAALDRVLAEPVYAKNSSPHYPACAMDGIAVLAEDTYGATELTPKRLVLGEKAFEIDTGDSLPQGCDAVIMVEDITYPEEGIVELIQAASPWQHVRSIGEDLVTSELILPVNHKLRAYDIGGCLAGGVTEVQVIQKPKVAIIPTGSELVPPGSPLKPGDIVEYNSQVLGNLVKEIGGEPLYFPIVPDVYELLEETMQKALSEADLVLINAGSSAGRDDYTAKLISKNGELLYHGLAIKPGKPGMVGILQGKPVIGVPGYPVSAVLVFDLLARPVIYGKQKLFPPERPKIKATLAKKIVKPMGVEEFVRVNLGRVESNLIAIPISRGAGVISSLIKADGILRIPRLSEGYGLRQTVEIELLNTQKDIENSLVVIGSHDLTLDIIANKIRELSPLHRLVSANVGSLAGIMAIKKGEAHLAGMHLLDEETGEYNISYLERYLSDEKVVLLNLAYRSQGLMVQKGNPLGIKSLEDIILRKLSFINRQYGSGTRILLDYLLEQKGLDSHMLLGYEREEFTHLAIAASVQGGSADAGMGIASAAQAFDLDFIPVVEERYDLCLRESFCKSSLMEPLIQALRDEELKNKIITLGGYDLRHSGQVMWSNCGITSI